MFFVPILMVSDKNDCTWHHYHHQTTMITSVTRVAWCVRNTYAIRPCLRLYIYLHNMNMYQPIVVDEGPWVTSIMSGLLRWFKIQNVDGEVLYLHARACHFVWFTSSSRLHSIVITQVQNASERHSRPLVIWTIRHTSDCIATGSNVTINRPSLSLTIRACQCLIHLSSSVGEIMTLLPITWH